ncbi:MAG: HMA2 domain-containing protein [Wolinella sp.]
MITTSDLERLAGYFTPIHHVPGRLRVRVNPAIQKESKNSSIPDIESFIKKIPGIKSFKLNKIVASLTIEYDSHKFPTQLWDDWLACKNLDVVLAKINSVREEIDARG